MFERDGFEFRPNFAPSKIISNIMAEFEQAQGQISGSLRNAEKKLQSVHDYLKSGAIEKVLGNFTAKKIHFIRAILFNKSLDQNWGVGWHQDKTVCVPQKFEAPGWGPWSIKDGTIHVQPPIEVLEEMFTLRIHLDEANEDNGCLKIVPGSHVNGLNQLDHIDFSKLDKKAYHCNASSGDALLMRPHILHSSCKSLTNTPRRILHLEYCTYQLPCNISWKPA